MRDTRAALLDAAFFTFYEQGYQGSNIATILKEANANKGSMYHYFKSKKEIGLAVIEERLTQFIEEKYFSLLRDDQPFASLFKVLKDAPYELKFGCPFAKLTQEMALIDELFKERLAKVYKAWEYTIEQLIEKAVEIEEIEPCDTRFTAKSILSFYEGALVVVSVTKDMHQYHHLLSTVEESFY